MIRTARYKCTYIHTLHFCSQLQATTCDIFATAAITRRQHRLLHCALYASNYLVLCILSGSTHSFTCFIVLFLTSKYLRHSLLPLETNGRQHRLLYCTLHAISFLVLLHLSASTHSSTDFTLLFSTSKDLRRSLLPLAINGLQHRLLYCALHASGYLVLIPLGFHAFLDRHHIIVLNVKRRSTTFFANACNQ